MRPASFVLFGLLAFAAAAAHAQDEGEASGPPPVIGDCTPPAPPTIPDGAVAPGSELKTANGEVKTFVAAGGEYTTCLDDHEEALGDEIDDEQAAAVVGAHNAMVDQMNAIAADFNAAIKAYRARKSAEKEQAEAASE